MKRISLVGLVMVAATCAPDPLGGVGSIPDAGGSGGVKGTGGATFGTGGGLGTGGAPGGGTGGAPGGGTGGAPGGGTGGAPATGGRAAGGGGSLGAGGAAGTGGRVSGGGGALGTGGATGAGGMTAGAGGQSGRTNPLTQAQVDSFVAAHNQARSGPLNPPPSPALGLVTWDPILADVAYNYLTKCLDEDATSGLVDHNANRMADYAALGGGSDYVGENIYATTANTVTAAQAVSGWMSEAPLFTYGPFTAANLAAGHYTQVVWRASVRIGCAIFNCPTTVMYHDSVLCDYAPGGNITGQRPY